MKKISILVQWLVVLALAAIVVYTVVRPKPRPHLNPEQWKSWNGFLAVSYAGIGRTSSDIYPSAARLKEHIAALHRAGFQTIRPDDAAAYLAGRSPLPERAILLMFEGGRKDSFIRATPSLQRAGFVATMFVPTKFSETWGGFYLKAPEIRKVARIPTWSFGSMGHEAVEEIHVDGAGATGHFLTRRRWAGSGPESAEEFRQRVLNDYSVSAHILEDAAGRPVTAFLYPFSDAGAFTGSDPAAAEINRAALTRYYKLAFARADGPFNGPDSDPLNLTRLRVSGEWSGGDLVRELENFMPRQAAVKGAGDPAQWLLLRGAAAAGNAVELPPDSAAWIRGSDGWMNVDVTAAFERPEAGQLALYARYAGPAAYVRASLDRSGLRVQERLQNRMQTLAARKIKGGVAKGEVRLRVKGNRAWVWLNGQLAAGPLPLSRTTLQGQVGVEAVGEPARVTAFEAAPLRSVYAFADAYGSLPDDQRDGVSAVLLPWFAPGSKPELSGDQRADALRSAAVGIEPIPLVRPNGDIPQDAADEFAAQLADVMKDPVLRSLIQRIAVESPPPALASALRARGFALVLVLPPADAFAAAGRLAGTSDMVLIDGPTADIQALMTPILKVCPAYRLIIRQDAAGDLPPGIATALRFGSPEEARP